MHWNHFWKENWDQTRARHTAWWNHEGLILHLLAPKDSSLIMSDDQVPFFALMSGRDPGYTADTPYEAVKDDWTNPARRATLAENYLSRIYFGGESFPFFDTQVGPGNLATFLGSEPGFAYDTVWYKPCISDPATHPPLRFDPDNPWFQNQKAIIEAGLATSQGRYLVGMPDLVENIDILSALRDPQMFMLDLIERPDFVSQRVDEISRAYVAVFDALYDLIKDPWGGNAFSAFCIWGPGKTAKVQCDAAALISPRMFNRFVVPALAEQCAWLDYSIYHLDGTQAIPHLDSLLQIEALNAVEWTPQHGIAQGGDPVWYDMYRKILAAGKSVQLVDIQMHEVIPLLDALGPDGLFLMANATSVDEAQRLEEAVERYR